MMQKQELLLLLLKKEQHLMPDFKYVCANGHAYSEKRPVEMEQIFKVCQNCGTEFTEVK